LKPRRGFGKKRVRSDFIINKRITTDDGHGVRRPTRTVRTGSERASSTLFSTSLVDVSSNAIGRSSGVRQPRRQPRLSPAAHGRPFVFERVVVFCSPFPPRRQSFSFRTSCRVVCTVRVNGRLPGLETISVAFTLLPEVKPDVAPRKWPRIVIARRPLTMCYG